MSKALIAGVLFLNAALYEPAKICALLGSELRSLGGHLNSVINIDRVIPARFHIGR